MNLVVRQREIKVDPQAIWNNEKDKRFVVREKFILMPSPGSTNIETSPCVVIADNLTKKEALGLLIDI